MTRSHISTAALIIGLGVSPAGAQTALIVANSEYDEAGDVAAAADVLDAEAPLDEAGYKVLTAENLGAQAVRKRLARFQDQASPSGPVAIVLSGHFATAPSGTWFMGSSANAPSLADVGTDGVSLDVVMGLAAAAPGRAAVLLGFPEDGMETGPGLDSGIGGLDVPQGVTVIRGPAAAIADFAAEGLVERGATLQSLLEDADGLMAEGFLGSAVSFLPEGATARAAAGNDEAEASESERRADAEAGFWRAIEGEDTVAAYRRYLDRYPDGRFAAEAQSAIEQIQSAPERQAQSREDQLGLGQSQRSTIQQQFTLLGYDTRGTEGVFGPGTRSAVQAWQADEGYEATGYLTAAQVDALAQQAEDRRQAQQSDDRAYWRDTGSAGDAAGLRAYLDRYPQGEFADLARDRLDEIEAAQQADAADADRAAWNEARTQGTVAAYRDYLERFPDGAFIAKANARLDKLTAKSEQAEAQANAAAQAEQRLGLNQTARNLVERRLAEIGLQPGPVDGTFDDSTRQAIRSYQQERGLEATGFLDEATAQRMLAGTALGILQQ